MNPGMNERAAMKCEVFEILGVDFERDLSLGAEVRRQAMEHARICQKCAALRDSWDEARAELASLREFTRVQAAPPRVKIRLLQEFQIRHHSEAANKTVKFVAWPLVAAALLVCAISLESWRASQRTPVAIAEEHAAGRTNKNYASSSEPLSPAALVANANAEFTPLPGSIWQETDEGAAIVRVGMQRAALGALGFPVNEERAGDWIQVDLLVAVDGSPQAVRFVE
jgi:hypothetical protein